MVEDRRTLLFDRTALLAAFDELGRAAHANGDRLELAIYGGSALMLASNFRFATEDVDIAVLGRPWPTWLSETIAAMADRNGWSPDWLNDAVTFHLSPLADRSADHVEFGSFPRDGEVGLSILVPSAAYMLALKLKAMRTLDAVKGQQESDDIHGLMKVVGVDAETALDVLKRFFPKSGMDAAKQAFLLKHLVPSPKASSQSAPTYPRRSLSPGNQR